MTLPIVLQLVSATLLEEVSQGSTTTVLAQARCSVACQIFPFVHLTSTIMWSGSFFVFATALPKLLLATAQEEVQSFGCC